MTPWCSVGKQTTYLQITCYLNGLVDGFTENLIKGKLEVKLGKDLDFLRGSPERKPTPILCRHKVSSANFLTCSSAIKSIFRE